MSGTSEPQISTIDLEQGQPTELKFNRPVKFRMEFAQGTYVEGVIPANCGLTVCSRGDIVSFNVTIDQDSTAGLRVVESEDAAN